MRVRGASVGMQSLGTAGGSSCRELRVCRFVAGVDTGGKQGLTLGESRGLVFYHIVRSFVLKASGHHCWVVSRRKTKSAWAFARI